MYASIANAWDDKKEPQPQQNPMNAPHPSTHNPNFSDNQCISTILTGSRHQRMNHQKTHQQPYLDPWITPTSFFPLTFEPI